jgi:hypothetical protein
MENSNPSLPSPETFRDRLEIRLSPISERLPTVQGPHTWERGLSPDTLREERHKTYDPSRSSLRRG